MAEKGGKGFPLSRGKKSASKAPTSKLGSQNAGGYGMGQCRESDISVFPGKFGSFADMRFRFHGLCWSDWGPLHEMFGLPMARATGDAGLFISGWMETNSSDIHDEVHGIHGYRIYHEDFRESLNLKGKDANFSRTGGKDQVEFSDSDSDDSVKEIVGGSSKSAKKASDINTKTSKKVSFDNLKTGGKTPKETLPGKGTWGKGASDGKTGKGGGKGGPPMAKMLTEVELKLEVG
ncbi:hypothetical protein Taro_038244 [Colocasia esculenta]|uniref:Uncharacterized protein n=1 Tax=Colocasia esculenta TaxID=4460 RepID=A0A843WN54_COLES|nr:hypothetical protein [Colocasia esculenta]